MKSINNYQKFVPIALVGILVILFQNCSQVKFHESAVSTNLAKQVPLGVESCPEFISNGDFENIGVDVSGKNYLGLYNAIPLSTLTFPNWDLYSSIPFWSTTNSLSGGNFIEVQAGTTNKPFSGEKFVELDRRSNLDGLGGIFQQINLSRGDYFLSYYYIARPGDPEKSDLTVFLDDHVVSTQAVGKTDSNWKKKLIPLRIASDGLYTLTFKARGNETGTGPHIDNISLKLDCSRTTK